MARSGKMGGGTHGQSSLRSMEEFALRGSAVQSGKKENSHQDGRGAGEGTSGDEEFANPNIHYGSQAEPETFGDSRAAEAQEAAPHQDTNQRTVAEQPAQYLDGTTDVTRTIAVGTPSAEMRDRFTRVLKGHIAIATARFPSGTTGSQLDTLARLPLWRAGLDYDHGTGHGVGSYLGVHEGPQRISKLPSKAALEPGMIVSNEPGYYKTGAFGIRIENLVTVIEDAAQPGDERPMLAFETLTLSPIDLNLVDPVLLTQDEIAWLNAYHRRVREVLLPQVDADTARWLEEATRPLSD